MYQVPYRLVKDTTTFPSCLLLEFIDDLNWVVVFLFSEFGVFLSLPFGVCCIVLYTQGALLFC